MAAGQVPPGLEVLGSDTFALSGEVYKLVTFLNQCLKRQNLIFGLSKGPSGRLTVTVYAVHPRHEGVPPRLNGRLELDPGQRAVVEPGPILTPGQVDMPE